MHQLIRELVTRLFIPQNVLAKSRKLNNCLGHNENSLLTDITIYKILPMYYSDTKL